MLEPSVSFTYAGAPAEVLSSLIEKRTRLLRESVRDAVVATAITVLKSLRADTRKARKRAKSADVCVEETGWVGGWEREGGIYHRVVRASSARRAAKVPGVFPVNNAGRRYIAGESVKVYRVTPTHGADRMTWAKNRNKGCWYVFAQSRKVAEDLGRRLVQRKMDSWRGLAKTALGYAMKMTSTRQSVNSDAATAKARLAAGQAASVVSHSGDGRWTIAITDSLDYAKSALRSGSGGVERAMQKAANSIAGRLRKVAGGDLGGEIATPFPEVRG